MLATLSATRRGIGMIGQREVAKDERILGPMMALELIHRLQKRATGRTLKIAKLLDP
jgi:hypothetical protein